MTGKEFMNAVANGELDILQLLLDSNQGSHHVSWKPGRLVIASQPGAIALLSKSWNS